MDKLIDWSMPTIWIAAICGTLLLLADKCNTSVEDCHELCGDRQAVSLSKAGRCICDGAQWLLDEHIEDRE